MAIKSLLLAFALVSMTGCTTTTTLAKAGWEAGKAFKAAVVEQSTKKVEKSAKTKVVSVPPAIKRTALAAPKKASKAAPAKTEAEFLRRLQAAVDRANREIALRESERTAR